MGVYRIVKIDKRHILHRIWHLEFNIFWGQMQLFSVSRWTTLVRWTKLFYTSSEFLQHTEN